MTIDLDTNCHTPISISISNKVTVRETAAVAALLCHPGPSVAVWKCSTIHGKPSMYDVPLYSLVVIRRSHVRSTDLYGPTSPLVTELLQLPAPDYGTVCHHISEIYACGLIMQSVEGQWASKGMHAPSGECGRCGDAKCLKCVIDCDRNPRGQK